MITLERLDDLENGRGPTLTPEELRELVVVHRIGQRQKRCLGSLLRRVDSIIEDLDVSFGITPEPAAIVVDPEFIEAEVHGS